jgi:hypothetical protein
VHSGESAHESHHHKDLEKSDLSSYRIENFSDKFAHYCRLARKYNCESPAYSAQAFVSTPYKDWHPLGFSQKDLRLDPCGMSDSEYCEFSNWDAAKTRLLRNFGSRSFLIENLQITHIPGRILVDFDNPSQQLIPDIGTR